MSDNLILSLFPGIGLLDMAFEEAGFSVVRGPDLLWGGDCHRFHAPPGAFGGVIGGPPCPQFSRMVPMLKATGRNIAPDLTPEFARIVSEAQPSWWLMENGINVPILTVPGYSTDAQKFDNRWLGEEQQRMRMFQFGSRSGARLQIETTALDNPSREATCMASEGNTGRMGRTVVDGRQKANYTPRRPWSRFCELQGLPPDFLADAPFTIDGKYRAVGNGVPLPLGRAVAAAVIRAIRVD